MKKIVVFVLLLAVSGILLSEINLNLVGAGARANGMGGAFIAIADDATAVTWNPAGLSQLEQPEFSAVSKLSAVQIMYKDKQNNQKNVTDISYFKLNFLSAVLPIQKSNMNIVASLSSQNQLNFENRVNDEFDNYEESGSANTINFGLGVRITPTFSLGMAINKWFGKYVYQDYQDPQTINMDVSGVNVGTGLLLNLANSKSKIPLKFGLTYKKPFNLILKNKNYKYTISMPPMVGFGSSLRIGQNFTIAFDYEIRAFKNRRMKFQSNNDSGNQVLSYYNLNQARLGMEYLLVTDFAVLPLRVGLFSMPTTYYFTNPDNTPKKQIVGSGFTLGTGLIFRKFSFDIAAVYSGWDAVTEIDEMSKYKAAIISSLIIYF